MSASRSRFNITVLAFYLALGVFVPSLLILWGTTLVDLPGAGAARVLLFFLVLPIFFIYITIVNRRFFPRTLVGSLRFFVPLAVNLILYGLSFSSFRAFATDYMLSSLPLFLGFMLLLLVGLTFLILVNVSPSTIKEAIISFVIVLLGATPVAFTAVLGYQLNIGDAVDPHASWRVVTSYVTSIGLIFYLHIGPIRQLYRDGEL